MAEIM